MSATEAKAAVVTVTESGLGPYGQIVMSGHHVLGADEPETSGGHDTGPDPFAHVMAGLGACTAMTIRMYAARKGWTLDRVTVRVSHEKRGALARHLFKREIMLHGPVDEQQRGRMTEIAEHCPVHKLLQEGAEIETTLG